MLELKSKVKDVSPESSFAKPTASDAVIKAGEDAVRALVQLGLKHEIASKTVHDLVTGNLKDANEIEALGKLAVFQGVQEFPARVKCASLAWHTLHVALNNTEEKISTE